ncbi:DUF924 family protein [Roseibium sp.]|uniref:DUF924 family protein n=1 Tax=Roseibium sp. TaxID=1936156 RepID=UPI003A96E9DB
MSNLTVTPFEVLDFWWSAGPKKWFARDEAFDAQIRQRFAETVDAAKAGSLSDWRDTPHGCLALIILLDQFTRNIFRNSPLAFEADGAAVDLATHALEYGFDKAYPTDARAFFYLPFEHAEDMDAQGRAVDLFRQLGNQDYYHYALIHMDVIRRFGRFPHRNEVLGRQTTAEEKAFLDDGGFSA